MFQTDPEIRTDPDPWSKHRDSNPSNIKLFFNLHGPKLNKYINHISCYPEKSDG